MGLGTKVVTIKINQNDIYPLNHLLSPECESRDPGPLAFRLCLGKMNMSIVNSIDFASLIVN